MINWILTSISFIVLAFYAIVLILLFISKNKIEGRMNRAIFLFTIAIFILALTRVLNLLSTSEIFHIPYLHEFLVFAFSFFILLATIQFYKTVKIACAPKISKNSKRK